MQITITSIAVVLIANLAVWAVHLYIKYKWGRILIFKKGRWAIGIKVENGSTEVFKQGRKNGHN